MAKISSVRCGVSAATPSHRAVRRLAPIVLSLLPVVACGGNSAAPGQDTPGPGASGTEGSGGGKEGAVSSSSSSSGGGGAGHVTGCKEPLFANGTLDAALYRSLAANLASEQAMDFRYGGGCDAASLPGPAPSPPHACEREHEQLEVQPNTFFTYELGERDPNKDDYSMTDGQYTYVADGADDPGVSHYTPVIQSQGVFGGSPQNTWQYYGAVTDIAFGARTEQNGAGFDGNGGMLGRPVAMARGYQVWSQDALVVLESGMVAGAGTFTGRTFFYSKFPADKRPVAVAVTSNNEFALFTIWDTTLLKSQVAVMALASGVDFWGDWTTPYPGLASYGMYTQGKVLGYVDLPGIVAATEISAASDFNICQELPYACWLVDQVQYRDLTLDNENNRQKFVTGGNVGAYSKAGFATVIAPAENKAVVLDLQPLFAYFENKYFTTRERFEETQDVGDAPNQWPHTFDVAPESMPNVVKTLDFDSRPTAVKASPLAGQTYVATVEGTLHVFDVGTLAGRHATEGSTTAEIREVGKVTVGANVTSIAHMKNQEFGDSTLEGAPRRALMVLSRAQKRIDWVYPFGDTPVIDRTLTDDRMVDPISLEDSDNHGTESYVLSVADYGGKQVQTYRYGPVKFHTNGGERWDMCADGTGAFEFGGALPVPGKPFALSVNNTP